MSDEQRWVQEEAGRHRAAEVLDAQEGTGPVPILSADESLNLLRDAHRIAIVGASANPARPSHGVMRTLMRGGYECVPINPNAGSVLGMPSFTSLEEAATAGGPFDIVDVFRRPEHTPGIAHSAVASGAGALWLQLGVVNWEAAAIAYAGGLLVVMDRCTAIELRRIRAP